MKNIDLRPSLRIVQHIAFIERFCGSWSRLRPSGPSSGTAFDLTSLIDGTKSNLSLDSSSPAPLHFSAGTELNASLDSDFDVLRQRTSRVGDPLLENLAELHLVEASFNAAGINELHRRLMR
ncbi:MAG TPA: hypothetical protein PLP17_15945, partial [Oligoflexia bacterium]|nr:hypothetical protein [Oligoflexia bacterium]